MILLQEAVSLKPDSSIAHNYLGSAYFQKGQYKQAKSEYEKVIKISPSYAEAYNNLGCALFMLREFPKSETMYRKALSLSPDLVSAHYSLGSLLAARGRIDESARYFIKGVELDPDYLEKNSTIVATSRAGSTYNAEILFRCAMTFAGADNVEKAVLYLGRAEQAGFKDWGRILKEKEFEKVRDDERIKRFIRR
jgi:tetratricopeptide (TPR) repeat protein